MAAVLAVTVALGGVVAGCSSDAKPSPMPTPSTSPTESESPSPTPPTMPAEAEGTSPAAAKAFVRHWIDALNYASSTGDVSTAEALSLPTCASCGASLERIAEVYGAGGTIQSDGWQIRTAQLVPGQPSDRPMIDVGIRLTPQRVVERQGAAPQTFQGGRLPMTFTLQWESGVWRVARLERSA